ncbi:MAG TPA: glycosyltransferase family 1 protein [Actinomycetota bacterium]|nr:glycosyltransferase family 1 protein [Actinomycetota bacterium]
MTSLSFLVDQLFAPAPGGMGTYTRELIPALTRADPSLEVTLFHSRFEHSVEEPWMATHRVETLEHDIRRLYPGWAAAGRPRLPAPLASTDLLHSPIPAAVPPKGPGQRLVVTVHDLAFLVLPNAYPTAWRLMYRAALRRAVRTADALIAPSRHTAEDLIRRTKLRADRVHVVPLASSLPESDADPAETLDRLKVKPPYVLFVGTLEPRKNLVRLIRAYRRLAAQGAPHRLVLAGPIGWQRQALLREAMLEGPGEVVLVGQVLPLELDALYRAADAFVYPSLYEGFGLPVIEAMSRGVPSVVSASSSLPEVAGEAALPVDPYSVAGMADALERITTDGELAGRLRAAALTRAARFSWDQTARGTLEVYKQVLSS